MGKLNILVVDDDKDIVNLLKYNLEREGYNVLTAYNGEDALNKAKTSLPNLIVLDLMLPQMDGLQVCRQLKRSVETEKIPIIMLTAKSSDTDVVIGLELGADDYIVKPFSINQFLARVKAILRRIGKKETEVINLKELSIYPQQHRVLLNGKELPLTITEFNLLELFASQPGKVFNRQQIIDYIRGEDIFIIERAVDVHIRRLRKKLGKFSSLIKTVRGVGYKIEKIDE